MFWGHLINCGSWRDWGTKGGWYEDPESGGDRAPPPHTRHQRQRQEAKEQSGKAPKGKEKERQEGRGGDKLGPSVQDVKVHAVFRSLERILRNPFLIFHIVEHFQLYQGNVAPASPNHSFSEQSSLGSGRAPLSPGTCVFVCVCVCVCTCAHVLSPMVGHKRKDSLQDVLLLSLFFQVQSSLWDPICM